MRESEWVDQGENADSGSGGHGVVSWRRGRQSLSPSLPSTWCFCAPLDAAVEKANIIKHTTVLPVCPFVQYCSSGRGDAQSRAPAWVCQYRRLVCLSVSS